MLCRLHMLITAVHNGGLVLGAFIEEKMIGFVFGFPGLETTPDGPRPKHCSHMMGIHPDHRDGGIGFALKRAQWQMVRHQGLDHITWTYDPLLSRNAYLNIAKLGAVCTTYRRSEYGDMRDGLNAGLPSDRFQLDWWINTRRVERRLGKRSRPTLKLTHVARSGLHPFYSLHTRPIGLPHPPEHVPPFEDRLLLAEIPGDFHRPQISRILASPVIGASSPANFLKQHSQKITSSLISSLTKTKAVHADCMC